MTLFVTPMLIAAAVLLVAALLAWRQRSQTILAWYAGVSLFSSLWPLNMVLEVVSKDWTIKLLILHCRPFLITMLCSCFMGMMAEYSGVFSLHRRRLAQLLFGVGLIVGVAPAADLVGSVFFTNVHQAVSEPYRLLWLWGPLGAIYEGYANILLFTGLVALWAPARLRGPAYRRNAVILTVATLLPTLANVFYGLSINPWPNMNLTAYGNMFSNIIWLWVLLGRRAFELIPLGRTAALDHLSDLLFILDTGGRLTDCNAAAVTALGPPGAAWVGRLATALPQPWCELLSSSARSEFEHGGRDFHVSREPLRTANGVAAGSLVLMHDVTEMKRAEQRLREAHHLEMVGRLAGGVAHGFNNYLTVILGHSALLRELPPDPDQLRGSLEAIEGASRDAAALTAQLLSLSRRQMLRPERLDVNEAISDVEKLLRQVLGGRVRLNLQLGDDLPAVELDRQHFERCLLEFGLNSRDALPQGGRLSVSTRAAEREVRIELEDDGPGIEGALLHRVFEPFFTTKDRALHSGLGLSVVHGFITQSGGAVEAFSPAGSGARFVISLPAAEASERRRNAAD